MNSVRLRKNAIYISAILVRVLVLILIFIFAEKISTLFFGANTFTDYSLAHDDFKYITAAQLYDQNATSLIDINAYINSTAMVGHGAESTSENLWFFMCCIFQKIFHTDVAIRIFLIACSIFSIKVIKDICLLLYNKKTAKMAMLLFALLPYPVIFSCFVFKDQFIMLLVLILIYNLAVFYKKGKLGIKNILAFAICGVLLHFVRNGFIVLFGLIFEFFVLYHLFKSKRKKKFWIIFVLMILVDVAAFALAFNTIIVKLESYLDVRATEEQSFITALSMNSVFDIYKFPFAFPFALLQPIRFYTAIDSWSSIVSLLNITMIPIAVANFLYIFDFKKKNMSFYIMMLALFFAILVMSIGIFRHYYCLLPIAIIFASEAMTTKRQFVFKPLRYAGSISLLFVLLIYFAM